MKNNLTLVYSLVLILGDAISLVVAFVAAYILRVKYGIGLNPDAIGPSNGRIFLDMFASVLPFWLLIFAWLGLYSGSVYEKRFSELTRLIAGSFIGLLLVVFWDYMSDQTIFPARLVPIYGFSIGLLLMIFFRTIARIIRRAMYTYGTGLTQILIVGSSAMTTELVDWLADSRRSGYQIVGVVGQKRLVGKNEVPTYPTFEAFTKEHNNNFHVIIQTELYANDRRNAEILTYAQENHIGYRFVPANSGVFVGNLEVELFDSSLPVITVHQTALFGWGRVVKKITDIVFGAILLVLASPFMLLVAGLIKISGGGSVFFRQKRLTRFNTTFNVYKFRTQYAKYDGTTPEEAFAMMGKPQLAKEYRANGDSLDDDPRITPIGKLLRATSLDELPQLFNVLRGDISFVGPRALIPQELDSYSKKHHILSVKSGLTGLAQVSGRRDINFEERRQLDLYYVQNWSLWLDITIILRTIRTVLWRSGAK